MREPVSQALGVQIPRSSDIRISLSPMTSATAKIFQRRGSRPELRVAREYVKDSHDFRITIIHEMCHLTAPNGHGPIWVAHFRKALDACGYVLHPAERTYTVFSAEMHPHLPTLEEGRRTKSGWMYICECPGRSQAEGGYGVRSRRSLDGRTCPRCKTLNVVYVKDWPGRDK